MKKLFALLLIAVLTLALFACAPDNGDEPDPTPTPEPEDEVAIFEPEAGLVAKIVEYLKNRGKYIDPATLTFAQKLDMVMDGATAIYVEFDPSLDYYVCAYMDSEHDVEEYLCCCVDEYTWLAFSEEDAIPEHYEGMRLIQAFRIDVSPSSENIFDPDFPKQAYEHITLCRDVQFENGYKVASTYESDAPFVFIDTSSDGTAYGLSIKNDGDRNHIIQSVMADGRLSLVADWAENSWNQDVAQTSLRSALGEYYELLIDMLDYTEHRYFDPGENVLTPVTIWTNELLGSGVFGEKYTFAPDESLVAALTQYMKNDLRTDRYPSGAFCDKLDYIKSGKLPLLTSFDSSSSTYYVCAYTNAEHAYESAAYCCIDEYSWVAFTREDIVPASYAGMKLVEAFRVDVATECVNLLNPSEERRAEHFTIVLNHKFANGCLELTSTEYTDRFIYFDASGEDTLYINSCPSEYHQTKILSVAEFDGKTYVSIRRSVAKNSVDIVLKDTALGDYYDELVNYVVVKDVTSTDPDTALVDLWIEVDKLFEIMNGKEIE